MNSRLVEDPWERYSGLRVDPPHDHPDNLPWPPDIAAYQSETNPAAYAQRASPSPFNEQLAIDHFGPLFVSEMRVASKHFRGDWWALACILRYSHAVSDVDPGGENPRRMEEWNHVRHMILDHAWSPHLEGGGFFGAQLQFADLRGAFLNDSYLNGARLDNSQLDEASLVKVNAPWASFRGAKLRKADFRGARLEETHLQGADLRLVRGLLLDHSRISGIDIEESAPDPWSTLRRKYTGPWFFIHLFLLVTFLAPYVARLAYLSVLSAVQSLIPEAVSEEVVLRFERVPAAWILVGGSKGWFFLITTVSIAGYNLLRGLLTLRVGGLRESEARSGISPQLVEYYGECNPIARSVEGVDFRQCRGLVENGKAMLTVWFVHARRWLAGTRNLDTLAPVPWRVGVFVAALPALLLIPGSGVPNAMTWWLLWFFAVAGVVAASQDKGLRARWSSMGDLSPLPIVGLYRLHLLASVLIWFSLASFMLNSIHWLLTTWLLVPR